MPDKDWTDTEWLDAGWADMARRLDEAMPVERRRRRWGALWWWGAGGLATLLLLLGGWWFLRPVSPTIEYFPIPRTGRTQVLLPAATERGTQSGTTASAGGDAQVAVRPRQVPEPGVVSSQPVRDSARSVRDEQLATAVSATPGSVSAANSVEPDTPTAPARVLPIPATRPIALPQATAPTASDAVVVESTQSASSVAIPGRRRAGATALVPGPTVPPVKMTTEKSPSGAILPVRSGTWRAGTEVVHTGDGVGGFGAGVGVLLRRRTSSRWTLTGGLRYHYWEQTWGRSQAFGNQRAEDLAFADSSALWMDESVSVYRVAQPGGENFRVLVARDPAANPRVRTHWFEIPLRVDRRFGRRWSVGLGIRPALLLNSSVTVPAVSELTTTGGLSRPESLRLSNAGVSEVTTSVNQGIVGPSGKIIRRGHLGWEVGVDYHLTTHWTVGAQYHRGQSIWQRDSELSSRTGLVALRLVRWW